MDGTRIIHGNALDLPLEDETVDLVITSPPYFALRSYRDGDEHYGGQIGSEATPQEFLEALWAATREIQRVLKPSGSIFVNLGDKYAGTGGGNGQSGLLGPTAKVVAEIDNRSMPRNNTKQTTGFVQAKSLMGLPWRYALGCIDQLGLILRAEVIWSKPNGLPESVTDRVRRSHEQWFHLVKSPRYFSAVDEIREAHLGVDNERSARGPSGMNRGLMTGLRDEPVGNFARDPLGKLPGSVWTIPSEPLIIPAELGLPDHFAAFPQEWPRRLILGWSPSGICTACGEGRRPVVDAHYLSSDDNGEGRSSEESGRHRLTNRWGDGQVATITGYACACTPYTEETVTRPGRRYHDHSADGVTGNKNTQGRADIEVTETQQRYHLAGWSPPPTAPATILDPFCGTGTVPMVARALGRTGIGVDLSADYCRLAEWRVFSSGHGTKAERRMWAERQLGLL